MDIIIQKDFSRVRVRDAQLVSWKVGDYEVMHPGGMPGYSGSGWNKSDDVCFPVFGPVKGGKVCWKGREYPMDQHGISRALPWALSYRTDSQVVFRQRYNGALVPNPKAGIDGHPEHLQWFPYDMRKRVTLGNVELRVDLVVMNLGGEPMPYNIAWHPAFRVAEKSGVFIPSGVFSLDKIVDEGPLEVEARDFLVAVDDNRDLWIRSKNLGDSLLESTPAVLWSPNRESGMIAVEPLLQPMDVEHEYFADDYPVVLLPGKGAQFSIGLRLEHSF